jgi:protein-disulfide isomerase-like protein with CxxC motif
MQHHTLCHRAYRHCTHNLLIIVVLFLTLIGSIPSARAASPLMDETAWRQTLTQYQAIPGLTSQQIEYGKTAIPKMNYNSQRIFRKICAIRGVSFEQAREVMELLGRERFNFEQVQAFEALCNLDTLDIKQGMAGLAAVKSTYYDSGRSFRSFLAVQGVSATQALGTISLLNNMDSANNRAAQAFFAVKGMRVDVALKGLSFLIRLRDNQAKAAETFAKIKDMDTETMLDGLELIQRLHQDDAWNARCLFTNKSLSSKGAWNWLVSYFALPGDLQESQYDKLAGQQKSFLLQALYEGGTEILWKINNLHAITDQDGYEISEAALNSFSMKQIQDKFDQLPPQVISRFSGQLQGAGRGQAIGILKQATSAGRMQTARNLSTANLYAVMAQGSELYDSSFREITVPVIQSRIAAKYQGDLLSFLRAVDPENRLVSDFVVSCAQKGKLTTFFPADSKKQKEILSLVATSAFRDEDSILLFSATLTPLLKSLEPEARTHLITLMSQNAEAENAAFAKLINVILQYYLTTYPELLGPADRNMISRLVVRHGAINLDKYQVTPFSEWKQDGRLNSVSMFHPDDDGRQSFVSNANLLMKNGYNLVASPQYSIKPLTEQEVQRLSAAGLPALFQAMRDRHFAVALAKKVGNVTITHTQFVYSDKENQIEMLNRFIHSKDEMLAQRGHSYWRSEQIVEPLTQLIEENKVTESDLRSKQRFLSLGSCGGTKAYTNLTRLFSGSVDILATIGTGLALINDPYNKMFFEIVANNSPSITWKTTAQQTAFIFQDGRGVDYLQPGSLTAILHKIVDENQHASGPSTRNPSNQPRI